MGDNYSLNVFLNQIYFYDNTNNLEATNLPCISNKHTYFRLDKFKNTVVCSATAYHTSHFAGAFLFANKEKEPSIPLSNKIV